VLGGSVQPILHVSQLAAALGLPAPAGAAGPAAAWDLVAVLDAWHRHLTGADWKLLVTPTPSRGRSLRNLTVNTFHPIELLPGAWRTGAFAWDPDGDEEREQALGDADAVRSYAERIAAGWNDFVLENDDALAGRDPRVSSPRGEVPFSDVLASQRWHAAYHYRQVVEFLRLQESPLSDVLAVERLAAFGLPAEIY
jgi:hypothetical protein